VRRRKRFPLSLAYVPSLSCQYSTNLFIIKTEKTARFPAGEHNWGYSVGDYLPELRYPDKEHPDFTTWPNAAFHQVRDSAPYQKLEAEWAEQREWMHPLPSWSSLYGWSRSPRSSAVATGAGAAPTVAEAKSWNAFVHELEDRLAPLIRPERPETELLAGMDLLPPSSSTTRASKPQHCGGYEVSINTTSGAIATLKHLQSGRVLASPGHELGTFAYYTFSSDDFALYGKECTHTHARAPHHRGSTQA